MKIPFVRPFLLLLTLLMFAEITLGAFEITGHSVDTIYNDTRFALRCSVIAFVYSAVLIKPSMFLAFIPVFMDSYAEKLTKGNINKKQRLLFFMKPLMGCDTCLSGQLAFWIYPFYVVNYSFFDHVYTICASLIFVIYANGWKTDL